MIVVMRHDASDSDIEALVRRIQELGFRAHLSKGEERAVVGVIGDDRRVVDAGAFEGLPGVAECVRVLKPYKLASRDFHPADTVVTIGTGALTVAVGGKQIQVMAGPCAVESWEQLAETAQIVKQAGARILRGGAFKPRTSPYAFQGLGEQGLELLARARQEFGLAVVTEVMTPESVPLIEKYADCLQIGARNMQNFNLLQACGRAKKPVMLKRALSGTIEELLMAAEYVLVSGNPNVILCERGIRTYETATRNTLDLSAVPVIKELCHLPVVVDPSHGTGRRSLVTPMARAGIAAGADGLMIEVHPQPDRALSDGPQSLTPQLFAELMPSLAAIAGAVGREL